MAQDYWGNDDEWQKRGAASGAPTEPVNPEPQATSPQPPTEAQGNNTFLNNILDKKMPEGGVAPATETGGNAPAELPKFNPLPSSLPGETSEKGPLPVRGQDRPMSAGNFLPNESAPVEPAQGPAGTTVPPEPMNEPSPTLPTGETQPEAPKRSWWWLVVVLIIIALGIGAYFILSGGTKSVKTGVFGTKPSVNDLDATRLSDLDKIQKALEQYYLANAKYPESKSLTRTQDSNCPLNGLVPQYMNNLPTDPGGDTFYYGYKSDNGTTYELSAIFAKQPKQVESVETAKGFLVTLSPSVALSNQ